MKIANIGGVRAVVFNYKGSDCHLLYNVAAMFQVQDEFGADFLDKLNAREKDGILVMLRMLAVMAEQGELARRDIGLDRQEIPEFEATFLKLQPVDIAELYTACVNAVNLGSLREVSDEDEEIDLGLAELQKKRKKRRPSISGLGAMLGSMLKKR